MKRIFTSLTLLLMTLSVMAQHNITGTVMDQSLEEGLIGASVFLKGTAKGSITDFDGSFEITNVAPGTYTLEFSYVGFATQEMEVEVGNGDANIGAVNMTSDAIGLAEVEVVANLAIDRRTPVAVTTLKGAEIEAKIGNQEYPEMLRKTPSVYVTKQGGGFGDSRINVRGFNQRNVAVMINGIPVNDMENGWVYWSNWAGLSDVTSSMQVQRGLGSSKLAVSAVGGSINIVTNAADLKKGAIASIGIGNDGYQKYGIALNSGLTKSGWAVSLQATHTKGDGYVDGTAFRAWSYYGSVTKKFSDKSMLSFTVLGAPQWHHQRLMPGRFDNLSLRTFIDPDNTGDEDTNLGRKFNWTWGQLDGKEFNFRRNFYNKPKAFINHYLTISPKTDLKTSAYVSVGRGGGTGPRGRLRTPGSVFDSFSGRGQGLHDANGQIRFDDIVSYNQGNDVAGWGQKDINGELNEYVVGEDGRVYYDADGNIVSDNFGNDTDSRDNSGSGFVRRASMNSHNWYGVLSTLTSRMNENFTLIAGVDARYYKGIHYRRLENLLGADTYMSKADIGNQINLINEPSPAEFGNFADASYKSGNILNYHNDGIVNWLGLFTQMEYTKDQLSAFISLSGSNQGFKRVDFFNYLDSDPAQTSETQNFLGGTVKGGANYNINEQHNVFVNAGFYSQQPLFDNVFINFRNDVNPDVKNQDVTAFEIGYGFRSRNLRANVNLYSTVWANRQFDVSTENDLQQDLVYNFNGVAQDHKGLEIELNYRPTTQLTFNGMASFGSWKYASNFSAKGTNIDTQQPVEDATIYADGLQVGDAAQTTFSLGLNYEIVSGLNIYADYYMADRLYADYDVNDDRFFDPNTVPEVSQLPAYSLVDAGVRYSFNFSGVRASLRFNMNNVLDTDYVSELETNFVDDPSTPNVNEFYDNRGIWGFGRTWNTGLKIWF